MEHLGGFGEQEYRQIAQRFYRVDGEVEIADNAVASMGKDAGAYVQAWIWIDDSLDDQEDIDGEYELP